MSVIFFANYSCDEEFALPTRSKSQNVIVSGGSVDNTLTTTCNVVGCNQVPINCETSYTYTSDLASPSVSWNVVSGDISLVSGQGTTTAVFHFGSGFSGGSIQATGEAGEVCSETIAISSVQPPSIAAVKVSGVGEPTDYRFTANVVGGATYNWYVDGVLQASGSGNTFDWYFPCNVSRTVKCTIAICGCATGFSNSITKTGGCDRT